MARQRPFRLATDRLVIRAFARQDVTPFTHYRNLDEVWRFQDWPVPYTRDHAHALIDEMEGVTGPVDGRWVQLAIDRDGALIGDVAVWLDERGELAMIGYTVAPEHQRHGYATEAVGAVVDWLFTRKRVHRVAATIDPRNVASARVLERLGFELVGTARSAALIRGEWSDDTRYSLLASDRRAWKGRPTAPPNEVSFAEITAENLRAVCRVAVAPSQRGFVSTVVQSIADATHAEIVDGAPVEPWYRAVVADGEYVGFVMIARRTEHHPVTYLWRFLIDARHQGRGIAVRAMGLLAGLLLAEGDETLELSFVDEPGGPEGFYRALGFERTGAVIDDEVVASARLRTIVDRAVRRGVSLTSPEMSPESR